MPVWERGKEGHRKQLIMLNDDERNPCGGVVIIRWLSLSMEPQYMISRRYLNVLESCLFPIVVVLQIMPIFINKMILDMFVR
jgi:hypothetical protein